MQQLIENLREGDCIVCEDIGTLPHFFKKMDIAFSVEIIYSGEIHHSTKQILDFFINSEVDRRLNEKLNLISANNSNLKEQNDFLIMKNKVMARLITNACVRDTNIEELHGGASPVSQVGDYSDVKVVFPSGEIPWSELSRISDVEMRNLMLEIEEKIVIILHLFLIGYSREKVMELDNADFARTPCIYKSSSALSHDSPLTSLRGNYDQIFNNKKELEKLTSYLFDTYGVSWDNPNLKK